MTSEAHEPESHHRQWLHALEDEATVPSREMQLARVYADYAPASGGRATRVSTRTMRKHTHMSFDAIDAGNRWLVEHGWLVPHGGINGQRKTYDLMFGRGGAKRKPIRQPERSAEENRSDSRIGQDPGRSGSRIGRRTVDRSDHRIGTVPTAGSAPIRLSEREQKTERTEVSLSGSKLRRALAAVVPDATEREAQLIREKIGRRPGVKSDVAVMLTEIEAGNGPALVADIRGAIRAGTPSPVQYAALCGWCSRPGHGANNCPTRPEPAPVQTVPPAQESIQGARVALRQLRRAPSLSGDPRRDLAAAQVSDARAARTIDEPESA